MTALGVLLSVFSIVNVAFWAVAAVMYLTVHQSNRLAFIALFVLAAIFLILAIGAAARIYQVLQLPSRSISSMRQKKAS